jgi:hypothetical protein
MKNFLTPKDNFPPVECHVFEDYDRLDALAKKRGYNSVERGNDDQIDYGIGVGAQNSSLHSGWVATMSDSIVNVDSQVRLLKDKIAECLKRKETVIIGFCRTGNFSVGYSIYVKR